MGEGRLAKAAVITALFGAVVRVACAEPVDLIRVISSRPDAVSGDEALVQLSAPAGARWSAEIDGREVGALFHRAESGELLALLTGLKAGRSTLKVRVAGGPLSKLDLVNYPLSGPIFSGPQQQPFICQTALNGLGPPLDAQCNAKTVVQYYYKPTEPARVSVRASWAKALAVLDAASPVGLPPGFKAYDPQHRATDVALTVTSEGLTVPYIVRRELGVINRAVYDIRFLHEPGRPLPDPWTRGRSGWNGRLVYELAGGCVGAYRQGFLIAPASHEAVLALGYAVATATLNIFANNCNDVLSAETLSMVKEHFIKEYGSPAHTIGWGDSAGAMQQHLIAQNYPGLLDGIIPYISFPDTVTYVSSSSDCGLLVHAFDQAKHPWTDEQKSAVTGFATWRVCLGQGGYAVPARNCDSAIPEEYTYDPVDHPKGVRCDIYDNEISVFGRDPKTGFAARPLDNVGVQYGLTVFNSGKIDAEQFIELNELAGGMDADGNIVAQRTEASSEAVQRAYRNGLVLTGGGGLADTPIIDWRWYSDDQGDNHDSFRSFVTRARLIAANGTAANQVILIDARANTTVMTLSRLSDPNPQSSIFARRELDLVQQMDRWLDNIAADRVPGSPATKVARDRPTDLRDSCWKTDGKRIVETMTYDGSGQCKQIYPLHADPRIAAGGPLTDDVLKCTLKSIDTSEYVQPLSVEQLNRLEAIFSGGVCDYKRPGVGQEIAQSTWRHY
jgi:Tannase-like family of unknown function (DUF6351)